MNRKYGFFDACVERLGQQEGAKLFDVIENVFDHLPVAARIDGRILAVHGGIGDGKWNLDDLLSGAVKRPLTSDLLLQPENAWLYNILWSDPIEDDKADANEVFGVHPSPRGMGVPQFAWNVSRAFCARQGLGLIIRSHQSKRDSISFDLMHDNLLVRVFSARDYEGHCNDGCVLLIRSALAKRSSIPSMVDGILHMTAQVIRSTSKSQDEAAYASLVQRFGPNSPEIRYLQLKKRSKGKNLDVEGRASRHQARMLKARAAAYFNQNASSRSLPS